MPLISLLLTYNGQLRSHAIPNFSLKTLTFQFDRQKDAKHRGSCGTETRRDS